MSEQEKKRFFDEKKIIVNQGIDDNLEPDELPRKPVKKNLTTEKSFIKREKSRASVASDDGESFSDKKKGSNRDLDSKSVNAKSKSSKESSSREKSRASRASVASGDGDSLNDKKRGGNRDLENRSVNDRNKNDRDSYSRDKSRASRASGDGDSLNDNKKKGSSRDLAKNKSGKESARGRDTRERSQSEDVGTRRNGEDKQLDKHTKIIRENLNPRNDGTNTIKDVCLCCLYRCGVILFISFLKFNFCIFSILLMLLIDVQIMTY